MEETRELFRELHQVYNILFADSLVRKEMMSKKRNDSILAKHSF